MRDFFHQQYNYYKFTYKIYKPWNQIDFYSWKAHLSYKQEGPVFVKTRIICGCRKYINWIPLVMLHLTVAPATLPNPSETNCQLRGNVREDLVQGEPLLVINGVKTTVTYSQCHLYRCILHSALFRADFLNLFKAWNCIQPILLVEVMASKSLRLI